MEGWNEEFWRIQKAAEIAGWRRRFGLRDEQGDDGRLVKGYLDLLHSNGMDFHTSLRILSTFQPTLLSSEEYLDRFTTGLVEATTTSITPAANVRAKADLQTWLGTYATRITSSKEKEIWESDPATALSEEDTHNYGSSPSSKAEDWESKRQIYMNKHNPRFILRQWILEETIANLEKMENIESGRAVLAKVLDVSSPLVSDGCELTRLDRWLVDRSSLGVRMGMRMMGGYVGWVRRRCWGSNVVAPLDPLSSLSKINQPRQTGQRMCSGLK